MMLQLSTHRQYYLYRHPTDMRKGFDGLSGLVRNDMCMSPVSGDAFIFLNRSRNRLKLLVWESDGYAVYYKRLEVGTFEQVIGGDIYSCLTSHQVYLLLSGIELSTVQHRKRYADIVK